MQNRKTKKKIRVSPAPRTRAIPRFIGKGKNGSSAARADATTWAGNGLSVLEKGLRPIPLFEIFGSTGNARYKDIMSIVDTEEKQLQAIDDLYQIVKAQPKYKDLKDKDWPERTAPIRVIGWLLRKLGPLAQGNRWTIDTYKEGRKTRFRFVVFKNYNNNDIKRDEEFLPLDFLPRLKKRDQDLHDLVVDTVALVSKINKVPLWDEDGDFSAALKEFKKEQVAHNYSLMLQHESYCAGPANEYLELIKARRKLVSLRSMWKRIYAYNADSERKRNTIWWLKNGLTVASVKQDISKNTYVPNFVTGTPITPFRQYKFVWCTHPHDILRVKVYSRLTKDEKFGNYLPVKFSITHPGEQVPPLKEDEFPKNLFWFLYIGNRVLLTRHREYYYKDAYHDQLTPSERLLEQIEQNEIKNSHR